MLKKWSSQYFKDFECPRNEESAYRINDMVFSDHSFKLLSANELNEVCMLSQWHRGTFSSGFDLKTCNLPEIEENQSITSAGWQTFLIEKINFWRKNTFSCKAILLCKIICKNFTDRKDFFVRPYWGCSNLLKNIREINQSVGCTRETWKWNHRFCLETVISADDP